MGSMTTFLSALILAALPTVRLQPLEGEPVTGTWTAAKLDSIVVQVEGAERTWPLRDVARVEIVPSTSDSPRPEADNEAIQLRLTDGTRLVVDQLTVAEESAEWTTGEQTGKLPVSTVSAILFTGGDAATEQFWRERLEDESVSEGIVIQRRGELDFLEGVIGNITADQVMFRLGEEIPVDRGRVRGIKYFRAQTKPRQKVVAIVHGQRGVRLRAAKLELTESGLRVTLQAGPDVLVAWSECTSVEFASATLVYLDTLSPLLAAHQSYVQTTVGLDWLAEAFAPRAFSSTGNEPMSLDGKTVSRGLLLRSRGEMVFDPPDGFRYFTALAGIADEVRPQGQVRLRILNDQQVLWEGDISGDEPALDMKVDISGVKRLRIVADYGDQADIGDHLILAEARLIP